MLEHENAILRAQLITLREEAQSLRHLLVHKSKSSNDVRNTDASAAAAAAVRNDLLADMVHQHHRAAAAAAAVAVATSTT